MFGKEPAIIIAAVVAVVQGVMIFTTGDVNANVEWVIPVLTALGGVFIRSKVFPTKTIREAGLSPQAVKENAENPRVVPHEGK